MTLAQRKYHNDKRAKIHYGTSEPHFELYGWSGHDEHDSAYDFEEELCDQIARFPSDSEVKDLCDILRVAALRELSAEITNGGMDHIKGKTTRLEYAKLINSWLATAEETMAAGRNVKRIADRRMNRS